MSAQPANPNLGMQVTTFENPLGINGFEFVEFAAPEGQGELLHDYFRKMGFTAVLHHKSRPITVYRQGGVNFLVNEDPGQLRRRLRPPARSQRLRFRDPFPEAGQRRVRHRRQQRRRSDHRQGRQQGRRRAGGEGHRRLHAVPGRPLRRQGFDVRRRLPADAGRRPGSEGLRPDLHRPPHPQPLLRQHAEVVGLLRAAVQLPRDPLLRHQGRQDRPGVEGDDRAGRHRPHPAQRIAAIRSRRSTNTSTHTRARASSTSPASPTTSTRRWKRCARRASNSSTRRTPIST